MYLNMGTGKNKMIDKINGVNILLYGHVGQRYFERLGLLQKAVNCHALRYNAIIKQAVNAIDKHFDVCLCKDDGRPVRNKINCSIKLKCEGKLFIADVAVLIKSTIVEWRNDMPKVIASDYQEYVDNGELKIGDKVIAIETIAVTVRGEDEEDINFSLMNKIDEIKVPNYIKHVYKAEMYRMFKNIINIPSMRTDYVYDFLKREKRVNVEII